jgi:hypothetical protein
MADDENGSYRLTDAGRRLVEAGLFHPHYERVKEAEEFAHFFGPLFEPIATTTTTTTTTASGLKSGLELAQQMYKGELYRGGLSQPAKLASEKEKTSVDDRLKALEEFMKIHDEKVKGGNLTSKTHRRMKICEEVPNTVLGIAPNMSSRYNVEEFSEQISTATTTTTTTTAEISHLQAERMEEQKALDKAFGDLSKIPDNFAELLENERQRYQRREEEDAFWNMLMTDPAGAADAFTATTTTTTTVDESKTVATNSDSDDDVPELEPMTEEDKTKEIQEVLPWTDLQTGIVFNRWTFPPQVLGKKADTATTTTTTSTVETKMTGPTIVEIGDEPVTTTTGQPETKADPVVRRGVAVMYDHNKSLAENVKMREEAEEEFKQRLAALPYSTLCKPDWKEYCMARMLLRDDQGINLPMHGWKCPECHVMFVEPTTWCAHEWRRVEKILDFRLV